MCSAVTQMTGLAAALIAVVLQLVISFGHIHLAADAPAAGPSLSAAWSQNVQRTAAGRDLPHADSWGDASAIFGVASTCDAGAIAPPVDPSSNHRHDPSSCAVCWALTMAAVVPVAVGVDRPAPRAGPAAVAEPALLLTRRPVASFRSRAPPLV